MTNLGHATWCGCPECVKADSKTDPNWRVYRIKLLLAKKANLDKEIDHHMQSLTDKERQELFRHDEYFPKDRIYKP
jgi:hypothetical protein